MDPPPAPPLPPPRDPPKPAGFALKAVQSPDDYFFRPQDTNQSSAEYVVTPAGPYFVYGTLRDPHMLVEILGLKHVPTLRPAKIFGYACKMWGQYPALEDHHSGNVVEGSVYQVVSREDAERLAAYETRSYQATPCLIEYTDDKEPQKDYGQTFLFCGNPKDLTDGEFDLNEWLRRMKRKPLGDK